MLSSLVFYVACVSATAVRDESACENLCDLTPGCRNNGSYCNKARWPPVCQNIYLEKSQNSANATPCSLHFDPRCTTQYPVRCYDISLDGYCPFPSQQGVAWIAGHGTGSPANGTIEFDQNATVTRVSYVVRGLEPHSYHGLHIHEKPLPFNVSTCNFIGGHYNPFYNSHGDKNSTVRHIGDLGNIQANASGVAAGHFYTKLVVLCGPFNVLQRTVAISAKRDDLGKGKGPRSSTTGDSGPPLACGNIYGVISPHDDILS
ncbi:Superoxide dismutase [Cu-Zn] [Perkinsus chesapeaki]|uniref:Superoxide dismutase [Cu-Zn] n=1 Tax=Perkinsus chesapeaki TaxID=330153 RepID=A0A7J6LQP9_PERCH|nr:Superoxide dismutase [Cu-Zn] [Perkinsus chesapeaki]